MASPRKTRILLIGSGGIGTITALNLEASGLCTVTSVLRSNYAAVKSRGFRITSLDHGDIASWRPSEIRDSIPDIQKEGIQPYDFVICTTKNTPDVPPSLVELVRPAVGEGSVIVLIQNGINIEVPFLAAFPGNVVLSGISLTGANEPEAGWIVEDDADRLGVAPFRNVIISEDVEKEKAMEFMRLYRASGKAVCVYDEDVSYSRWRKLLYNCVWNPICALADCDTGRMRLVGGSPDPIVSLVRPAMQEVRAVARSVGVKLEEELVDVMVEAEAVEIWCAPSMLQDVRKGRAMEVENILGEVVRTAEREGVSVPVIGVLYGLLRCRQWRVLEKNGLVDLKMEARKRAERMEGSDKS